MTRVSVKRGVWFLAGLAAAAAALFTAGELWPLAAVNPVRTTRPVAIVDVTIVDAAKGALIPGQTYRTFYRKGLELTGAAHRAGVRILAGTDYIIAGADVHRELEQLGSGGPDAGAGPRRGHVAPAEYPGLEAHYGAVTAGRVADLLVLRANPLADIRNTAHRRGRVQRKPV